MSSTGSLRPKQLRPEARLLRYRQSIQRRQRPKSHHPTIRYQFSIDEERRRFAAMLDGRQPTANEISAHEARLFAIHNARGNKTDELLRREAIAAGWKPRD